MSLKPTDEQVSIVDGFRNGNSMVIEAGAGTGKTSTLTLMALNREVRHGGLYIAYNKAIVTDAQTKFPRGVTCKTAHSLAFGAVGHAYSQRLNSPRLPIHAAAKILGVNQPIWVGERQFTPNLITSLALEAVRMFCRDSWPEITANHVVPPEGLTATERYQVRQEILPYAQRAWADITRTDGKLRFQHDHYLKMYQLTGPRLHCDYIMLDEAQDADPVIASIFDNQDHCQRVAVGDSAQAIYGWRGAVDALDRFKPKASLILPLSQSFRFGPAIADEATKWLSLAGSTLELKGWDGVESRLDKIEDDPDVILCRSNAGVVSAAMAALERGVKAAVVGGGQDIKDTAIAAQDLQAGHRPRHPQLVMFSSWEELKTHVNGGGDSDLRVLVRLVDNYGARALIRMVDQLVPEPMARLTVSTAHKAKGREWPSVKVMDDFTEPKETVDNPNPTVDPAEAQLAYVTVTRARHVLDRDGLAWVDGYL